MKFKYDLIKNIDYIDRNMTQILSLKVSKHKMTWLFLVVRCKNTVKLASSILAGISREEGQLRSSRPLKGTRYHRSTTVLIKRDSLWQS